MQKNVKETYLFLFLFVWSFSLVQCLEESNLPRTEQATTAQPQKDKFLSNFSSFLIIYLFLFYVPFYKYLFYISVIY